MATIQLNFTTDFETNQESEDAKQIDILKEQIQAIATWDKGHQTFPYSFNFIIQIVRELTLCYDIYDEINQILTQGIKACVNNERFIMNRSEGYTLLTNQINAYKILFSYFEKSWAVETSDSIQGIYIRELQNSISEESSQEMIQELLKIIAEFREVSQRSKFEEAHNITMILIDLGKYKEYFEAILKTETGRYYSNKAREIFKEQPFDIHDYIKFIESSLEKERIICSQMLVGSSEYLIIETLHKELVENYYKILLDDGLRVLIKNKSTSEISCLYRYISKVNLLKEMFDSFQQAICDYGVDIIKKQTDDEEEMNDVGSAPADSQKNPKKIIPELISLRKATKEILEKLDRQCDSQEHRNEFRKAEKGAFEKICEYNSDLIAEYLAKLFGFYLNKNSKMKTPKTDQQIEEELFINLIEMLRCIKSIDVFSHFFRKDMSARLLFRQFRSEELEERIMASFLQECGKNYIKKMQLMLSEVKKESLKEVESIVSDSMSSNSNPKLQNEGVIEENKKEEDSVFKCQILSQNNWSLPTKSIIKIPKEVMDQEDAFSAVYTEKFKKKKLIFNYTHSTCIIQAKHLSVPFEIHTSQILGLALLNFNDKHEIEQTVELQPYLKLLTPLLIEGPKKPGNDPNYLIDTACYVLNPNYKVPDTRKITILREATEDDDRREGDSESAKSEIISKINENRKFQIMAIMARILKRAKRLTEEEYFAKTLEQTTLPMTQELFNETVASLVDRMLLKIDQITHDDKSTSKIFLYI
ncbi:unnamed protein product [Moneuplotes crassus]|uniref:Cullin family profile domain-containing protein n=1 Tax=Euplotes crassus TaxID=5936 RepID=A0AAD1Y3M6_EUPCR|nr:unnamed protein product [Moneuplotes crassus]